MMNFWEYKDPKNMLKPRKTKETENSVIAQLRMERGLTQEQLAELSGVHFKTIGCIERGKTTGSVDTLKKIAKALKVDISELL